MGETRKKEKKSKERKPSFFKQLNDQIKKSPRTFMVYSVLRGLVIAVMIRCILTRNYESVRTCMLALALLLIPAFVEKNFRIELPDALEIIIYVFIFAAEILGEIDRYYFLIPGWDTMLHTINGFLCAAIGFSTIDLLNQKSDHIKLTPIYVALVAFCFSMTIGVLWEFIEFFLDYNMMFDCQKDFIVTSFGTSKLSGNGDVDIIRNITKTLIYTADGTTYQISNGYLDIGIIDTMKDLFVNFIGAVSFCAFGYFYTLKFKKSRVLKGLIPYSVDDLNRSTPRVEVIRDGEEKEPKEKK